ncbi:MAG: hypothetical protein FWH03_01245 [Firmicutes bacterium]|nr:hypothetical protein [Bacillota bacterium]
MSAKIKRKNVSADEAAADKAAEIRADYLERARIRRPLETQWQLNVNFVAGNQYCIAGPDGVSEFEKEYHWQERGVYNHVAPIFETRLAKLGRIRPKMSVRPASSDEDDMRTAKTAGKILDGACRVLEFSSLAAKAAMWSELCGSSFYKVSWDQNAGRLVGSVDGANVYEGEVRVDVCPPYELYPSSVSVEELSECESLIHAKAVPVAEVRRVWGVEVSSEEVEVFTPGAGISAMEKGDGYCLVIERYTRPRADLPNGEFAVVAGGRLLHCGGLPYQNGNYGCLDFPFVKQDSLKKAGNFFCQSVVERVIPIQRAYNAVKNRKHEFLNRISMGVLAVEDGSVDIDNLETEGLAPGKILQYRQGSAPPRLLETGRVPLDFAHEEERLLSEFISISGVSEIMRSSTTTSAHSSGVAIQLLIEQDDTRLSVTAEYVKSAIRKIGRQILRLYKQFAGAGRLSRVVGDGGEVELIYWNKSDITCDDVVFDTENEISSTPAVKQSLMFDLLRMGLLHDENGKLSDAMRYKILDVLGYGGWEFTRDMESLNIARAAKENLSIKQGNPEVLEIDRHDLHIAEHTKYCLGGEFQKLSAKNPSLKERLMQHIREHKQFSSLETEAEGGGHDRP